MSEIDNFHKHLDSCKRCRNEPFNLCNEGHRLIKEAVDGTSALREFLKKNVPHSS